MCMYAAESISCSARATLSHSPYRFLSCFLPCRLYSFSSFSSCLLSLSLPLLFSFVIFRSLITIPFFFFFSSPLFPSSPPHLFSPLFITTTNPPCLYPSLLTPRLLFFLLSPFYLGWIPPPSSLLLLPPLQHPLTSIPTTKPSSTSTFVTSPHP